MHLMITQTIDKVKNVKIFAFARITKVVLYFPKPRSGLRIHTKSKTISFGQKAEKQDLLLDKKQKYECYRLTYCILKFQFEKGEQNASSTSIDKYAEFVIQ